MNQLDEPGDISSCGPFASSSTPSVLNGSLPSIDQESAATRAFFDGNATNKESPGSTYGSSSETSLDYENDSTMTVRKAVDMEVEVLGTILPTADPPASLASKSFAIPSSDPPQDVPHNPEVLVQEELSIIQTFVPSSEYSIVPVGALEVPAPSKHELGPTTTENSLSATIQHPPMTIASAPGLPAATPDHVVPREPAELAVSVESPLETPTMPPLQAVDTTAWSALQTTERASTRLACKAASQSPTSSDSPYPHHAPADPEMHPANTSRVPATPSSNNDDPVGQSSDGLPKSSGAKIRVHRPTAPATPERLHQPVNLASPKGAIPYVEIPKFTVTAPSPVKHDPTHPGAISDGSVHLEKDRNQDEIMEDLEASGRSRRKRTQNVLLRDYVPNSSDSESRSQSPRPSSKKKRKQLDDPTSMNLESSARPAKKRVKKVTATTTAPVPSIRVREPSFDGKPGRSRSISQASLTSTRPPNSKASSSTSSGPFIQKDRCIKFNPSVPRCHACIGKKTGELCRYLDLRQFPGGTPQNPSGLPIWIDDPREPQEVFYPPYWNVSPTLPQTKRVLKVVADALLPYLAKELSHTRLPEIIRRNRELECRASCDYCATSIFGGGWICKICAREFCSDCRNKIVHLSINCSSPEEVKQRLKARQEKHVGREDQRLMYCQGGKIEHYGPDLRPITRFRTDELETTISDMGTILIESKMDLSAEEPENDPASQITPIPRHDPSDPVDPSGVGTLPFYVFSAENLTEEIFAPLWGKGQTVVVTGLLDAFQFKWTPDEFIQRYGLQTCHVVDCYDNTQAPIPMTVEDFFSQFGRYEGRRTCWKLKDWPPASLFSTEFPELYKDFAEAVPVPNYTRRDGVLNLAAHYPINEEAVVPDIGPKMYNAFESSELPGGKGSTRLHMDMADAVNVMLYAAPRQDGSPGCAVWDIYRAGDAKKIRQFLHEKFGFSKTDPIHSQHYYLDSDLRRELFEQQGVKSWRIYQKPGEAVFIPAGCAHQVCNLADCIKVAVDFVSPENIGRCEVLTAEFRQQNLSTVWKDDVLQLRHTLLHAWNSMTRMHPSLRKGNPHPASPMALPPGPQPN